MPDIPDNLPVIDNEDKNRYEVQFEGVVAVLEYIRRGDLMVLVHTGVPKEIERHGIAGQLSKFALEDARARELKVVPRCPYVATYIEHHPEHADLVVESN